MKSLSILGATGSIGSSALEIVRQFPDRFTVNALTAKTNVAVLARQVVQFTPRLAAVYDADHARQLKALLPPTMDVEIVFGEAGYVEAATCPDTDMVLGAMVGSAGLVPTLAAIDAGKDIALANKETLVMAGDIVMAKIAGRGVKLMPVDSEHSAIYQSLAGHSHNGIREILLTASGGPFLKWPAGEFSAITPKDALRHPNWSMGSKITIDSATLMNKGLEVIEARWLFNIDSHIGQLTFEDPDLERFPCLTLAYRAGEQGGTLPAVLNAANEVAVSAFLDNRLPFTGIYPIIDQTLNHHSGEDGADLGQIIEADRWARETALSLIRRQER
ncbi:MAG: 1-deoxy-D-xylulose-5-phosphate reductoisomerase [Desulfosarcina sp.]|nr:1-deoxy-D-xylulose-5-phosphate reductoisomerase [Desulfosarcina sp.]MBC2767955.1 1-deoxy-D-xylulose-5-phosphate reductoisomerase [Desulfosarcina sp.]